MASWILPWKLSVAWQPFLGRDVTYHNAASQENIWPGRHSITMPSTPEPARWSSGSSGGIGVYFGVYPSLQGCNFPIKRSMRRECGSVSGHHFSISYKPSSQRLRSKTFQTRGGVGQLPPQKVVPRGSNGVSRLFRCLDAHPGEMARRWCGGQASAL